MIHSGLRNDKFLPTRDSVAGISGLGIDQLTESDKIDAIAEFLCNPVAKDVINTLHQRMI